MRRTSVSIAAFSALTILAFLAGQASAAILSSGWSQFASWNSGGIKRCISHKSIFLNDEPPTEYEEAGYGYTRSKKTDGCDQNDIKDEGRLGVNVIVFRVSDGNICGATGGYLYNIDPTYLLERGTLAGCPNAARRKTASQSKAWHDSQSSYEYSGWLESPADHN